MNTEQSKNNETLAQKLRDLEVPGAVIEFDPEEAELLGAFEETALSESDALDGAVDLEDALEALYE